MLLSVLAVGGPKGLADAAHDYERRAGHYWRLKVTELPHGKGREGRFVVAQEEEAFAARIDARYKLVCLSREGRSMSSVEFAKWLQEQANRSASGVHFLIGGAFGLGSDLISRADLTLSLSSFTLPHDVARLLLAEQIYRAGTILRNEPYHKGPA
ncbi:MAG: 23S rRNA (pseudouridine(1915)-N(3))-methyltransferase RlmH [Longimicrobiales bacterium]